MKINLKRVISNLFLLAILLVSIKKYTEWNLSVQAATDDTKNSELEVQTESSETSEIKTSPVAGVTINLAPSVSVEKLDTNVVTSSIESEEQPPSTENLIQTYNDRWQEIYIDYANREDIYSNMTYPLAKIIYAEGGNQNDECQQYIGYVVINRIESKYYPNSLHEVFFSDGYAYESQKRYQAEECSDRAIENAQIVVNNYYNHTMPVSPALVYQSSFSQGVNQFQIDDQEFGYDQRIINDLEN